ncbi:MAG: glycoside hydrolase family 43 protein [Breznakibacter sp.]
MKLNLRTYGLLTVLLATGLAAWGFSVVLNGPKHAQIIPGQIWTDTDGKHINAHGGGILEHNGRYYWFGEHRSGGRGGFATWVGVGCYASTDLMNWENKGIALEVVDDPLSEIVKGCIIERPKVVFNDRTNQFVMWFHLELKGKGYEAAKTGVAVSKKVEGPYTFIGSFRPNAGAWPMDYNGKREAMDEAGRYKWWTSEWYRAVNDGLFVRRDFVKGQMSRDMTVFKDDDGRAYHIHSSEENLTIHISELSDDYLSFTGRWIRVFPAGHNEAPAVFKFQGKYYMVTSGCTGWDANAARLAVADSMLGNWTSLGNPCVGENADKTFFSQSTHVLPVNGGFIFMADRWTPKNLDDARYVWLPFMFENGLPKIYWNASWSPDDLGK